MRLTLRIPGLYWYLAALVVVVTGFLFWQSDLESDPPMYYSGLGQSLSTDPYLYTVYARNLVLFHQLDPFHDPEWRIFQKSLVTVAAYAWFSLTEVSRRQANLVGVVMSFAGLILVLLALLRRHPPWVIAAVALCWVVNVTLLTYGRLPYLENALLLWLGLILLVWTRYYRHTGGAIAVGAALAAAAITGKLFGALLLPAIICSFVVDDGKESLRRSLAVSASFGAVFVLLVFILYKGDFGVVFTFLQTRSVGLYGTPEGLKTPWGFIEHVIAYGASNRLFYLNPALLLFVTVGAVLLAVSNSRLRTTLRELPPASRLACFWILFGWLGLSPFNYSPLRYTLFLIPAILVFCFSMIAYTLKRKSREPVKTGIPGLIIIGVVVWTMTFHAVKNFFYFLAPTDATRDVLWLSALAGVAAALVVRRLQSGWINMRWRRLLIAGTVLLMSFCVVVNGFRFRRKYYLDHAYTIAEANADLPQILGKNAVVSGPYGPALTVESDLGTVIHFFDEARKKGDIFSSFPITHIATDSSNWQLAVQQYPFLGTLKPVAVYWIRDYQVSIYRTAADSKDPRAQAYVPTAYERAVDYYHRGSIDSALALVNSHSVLLQQSKSAGLLYSRLLIQTRAYDKAAGLLMTLADRYPTDFNVLIECGHFLQQVALATNNQPLLVRAQHYYERATIVNPYKAGYANTLYGQTLRQMTGQTSP
jgi:hypothetical protein